MKKYVSLLVCFFATAINYAQTDVQVDSLVVQMCRTLETNVNLTDSIRLMSAYDKHLFDFALKHNIRNEEDIVEMFKKVEIRFQRNCTLAYKLTASLESYTGDWKMISVKPKNNVTKKQCRDMSILKKFYYIEPGKKDKTYVTIDNGLWYEEFTDGTYSKLKFRWVSDCEFEIEFIESNNDIRKYMSRSGEKYHYGIFNRKANDFEVWLVDPEGNPIATSWLHAIKK